MPGSPTIAVTPPKLMFRIKAWSSARRPINGFDFQKPLAALAVKSVPKPIAAQVKSGVEGRGCTAVFLTMVLNVDKTNGTPSTCRPTCTCERFRFPARVPIICNPGESSLNDGIGKTGDFPVVGHPETGRQGNKSANAHADSQHDRAGQ